MMEDARMITPDLRMDDEQDNRLRPRTLADYFGQTKIKESLSVYMQAAVERNEPLDHILLYGPP
ncbi:MAG: Holliday junction branch migration DNA helicase RuvB, partial [Clostridia bacterium]|nr:Holliday junction branch migration DNA helicase RuvB [Clostridia bacterium]